MAVTVASWVEGLVVVNSSSNTPHYCPGHFRQSSAALKSRMRGHDSIHMRSPRSSAVLRRGLVAIHGLKRLQPTI